MESVTEDKFENSSAIVRTSYNSSEQIADPVVYKLVRVDGDGRLVPATDDEVMQVEDLIVDDNSLMQFVSGTGQIAVCTSIDEISPEKTPSNNNEGLLKFEDCPPEGDRANALADTTVDTGKLNSQFEEIASSSNPTPNHIDQSEATVHLDPPLELAESEPSTSGVCASWKPDFSRLKGEICLDNLSVRELHATFKATFGRETSVKDKQWLKRRISMGLSNSCDVAITTFIIEDNTVKKKGKFYDRKNEDGNSSIDPVAGLGGINDNYNNVTVDHQNKMEDHVLISDKRVQSATSEHDLATEDLHQEQRVAKRVRKPTKRYIEEVSEMECREYSGKLVSSVKNPGHGQFYPRTRVRPIQNIQPIRKPLVTRQDSLGGSGVEIPYVSRIRRGRPRENFMSLMKFQTSGVGIGASLVKEALDGHGGPQSDNEIELKEKLPPGRFQQPEREENAQYSKRSTDMDVGSVDSSAEDSEDNLVTVPTAKGGIRRKHHRPWTLSEVIKLVEGVSRYGAGRWSEIKRISFATYSHRTSVDLKDKWRNLLRASFVQLPAEKGMQNSRKQSSTPIPVPILLRVRELAEMQSQATPDLTSMRFAVRNGVDVNDTRSGFL